jgi:hypothetical protein
MFYGMATCQRVIPPDTFAGDLGGSFPAQFRVWPDCVVILPPGGQQRQVLPRVVIDRAQDSEAPTADQAI